VQLSGAVGLLGSSSSFGISLAGASAAARAAVWVHGHGPLWTLSLAAALPSAVAPAAAPASTPLPPFCIQINFRVALLRRNPAVLTATTELLNVGDIRKEVVDGLHQIDQIPGFRGGGVGVDGRGRHPS